MSTSDIPEKSAGFERRRVESLLTLPNSLPATKLFRVGDGTGPVLVWYKPDGCVIFLVKFVPNAGNLYFFWLLLLDFFGPETLK